MTDPKKMQQLYETAFKNEENYGGCAQCTLSAINDHVMPISDDIFKAATALAGGGAASGNLCGAASGAILAISTAIGRDYASFKTEEGNDNKNKATELSRKVLAKFEDEYGSFLCENIQENIFGKKYKMYVPEEKAKFLEAGGHGDEGCTKVCGKAAQWIYEVLEEEGLVK